MDGIGAELMKLGIPSEELSHDVRRFRLYADEPAGRQGLEIIAGENEPLTRVAEFTDLELTSADWFAVIGAPVMLVGTGWVSSEEARARYVETTCPECGRHSRNQQPLEIANPPAPKQHAITGINHFPEVLLVTQDLAEARADLPTRPIVVTTRNPSDFVEVDLKRLPVGKVIQVPEDVARCPACGGVAFPLRIDGFFPAVDAPANADFVRLDMQWVQGSSLRDIILLSGRFYRSARARLRGVQVLPVATPTETVQQ